MTPRRKALFAAVLTLLMAWGLAFGGRAISRALRVTPDTVLAFLREQDLSHLSGEARGRALRKLASLWNALSLEERRTARGNPFWRRWFSAMTDEEKAAFLEATLPSGFNQMMNAFEQMPPERRRKAIEETAKRIREARETAKADADAAGNEDASPDPGPQISREVQERVVQSGLKTFYDSGSTQLKSEMAPLLEELQRSMEGGRLFRENRRPRLGP